MHKLKIAIVVPKYGLLGGAEGFVFELTERLAMRPKFEVHVFANKWRPGKAPIAFHKVPIINFPRWLQPVSFAWFANKKIKAGNFDVIHSHERLFEMDLFSFHGIPHSTWRREVRQKLPSLFDLATAWVEKKGITHHRLKKILPVSSLVASELQKLYPIPPGMTQISHPGVSLERFDRHDREQCRKEIQEQYGFTDEDIVVLFVSMNFEIKGLDLVLEGLSRLNIDGIAGKRPKLLVVGRGDEKKYRVLAQKAGVGSQVVFAGATCEVEKFFLASDIFVMPSVYDTFGLVVLEAMAARLPVIISENVGARDIVVPGQHGFIVPQNPEPSDMTLALTMLLKAGDRRRIGNNCRELAEQFSWDRLADNLAELYLISGHSDS